MHSRTQSRQYREKQRPREPVGCVALGLEMATQLNSSSCIGRLHPANENRIECHFLLFQGGPKVHRVSFARPGHEKSMQVQRRR